MMHTGKIGDYQKGLYSRIGLPHLQFLEEMEAEHTVMAGCDLRFTTRNSGVTTTAKTEWCAVVRGEKQPAERMQGKRVIASIDDKCRCDQAKKAKLRREEVIAVMLYSGPMYLLYNCVLAQWSDPPEIWETLRVGRNKFTTTLCVLVSAVQKLSAITVIPASPTLYRGTGGLAYLPEHFTKPDEYNCHGMTEFGFMSSSRDMRVAVKYSGVLEGRPHAMLLEIQPSCADRGASIKEFSQYPHEEETLFLPMSYVQKNGDQREEHTAEGILTIVPVRVNVNIKADQLEDLEGKKRSFHIKGFQFRIRELRSKLRQMALAGDAGEQRLKFDK